MTPPTFAFHSDEKVSHGFFRILGMINATAESLVKSKKNASELTHEGRVLIKRTRALIWLVRKALTPALYEQSKNELRRASRLMAVRRDRTVTQSTLRELAKMEPVARVAIQATLKRISAGGPKAAEEKKAMRKAMSMICGLTATIKNKTPPHAKWPSISKRLDRAWKAASKAEKKAEKTERDLDYHEWRKKAKRFFYELEMIHGAAKIPKSDKTMKRADKLQESLGKHHDLVIVEQELGRIAIKPKPDPRLTKLVRRRKKRLVKESRKTAGKLKTEI